MSQQPPDWFRQPKGPRIGCADVTIVSIASIAAFVLLIFVVLRPDFARFIDLTGGNDITVGAVRATDTPGGPPSSVTPGTPGVSGTSGAVVGANGTTAAGTTASGTTGSGTTAAGTTSRPPGTTPASSFSTAIALLTPGTAPATPTVAATPTLTATVASFVSVKLNDACRLRQTPSYQAAIIQIFPKGTAFKAYDEQQSVKDPSTGVTEVWQKVEPADNTNRQGWMIAECLGT